MSQVVSTSLQTVALDYQNINIHFLVSKSSRVPDHCRPFALSHKSDEDFTIECDHQHDLRCDKCDLIPSVFDEVELALKDSVLALSSEDKKEME